MNRRRSIIPWLGSALLLVGPIWANPVVAPANPPPPPPEVTRPAPREQGPPPWRQTELRRAGQTSGGPGESRPRSDRPRGGRDSEAALLEGFLSLSPEQLANARRTLERIEQMAPEEREALREAIREQREEREARARARRESTRQFYRELDPEQRRALRESLSDLPPRERFQRIEALRNAAPEERESALKKLMADPPG